MIELSEREIQVLERLAKGERDKKIADELGISPRSAQHHADSALAKLGAETRFQAGFLYGQMIIKD